MEEEERYILTEEGVAIARDIHVLYLAGYSIEHIADELNLEKEGIQVLYAIANYMGALD